MRREENDILKEKVREIEFERGNDFGAQQWRRRRKRKRKKETEQEDRDKKEGEGEGGMAYPDSNRRKKRRR